MKYLALLFNLILISLLTGCMTTHVKVDVSASDSINLSKWDESLPVVLKVYQLTDIQAFKNASFEELWKSDKKIRSDTLIIVEERTIQPSDKLRLNSSNQIVLSTLLLSPFEIEKMKAGAPTKRLTHHKSNYPPVLRVPNCTASLAIAGQKTTSEL